MKTLILKIQYDGSAFHGYQKQNTTENTVQTQLENCAWTLSKKFFPSKDSIHFQAAGRTDRGVHALGQVASLALAQDDNRCAHAWQKGLNHFLPDEIMIKEAVILPGAFHARFDAHARSYVYVLESEKNIFLHKKVSFLKEKLDFDLLDQCAQKLIGQHNFQSFQGGSCQAHSPIKTLYESHWSRQGSKYIYHVKGCGFLHHMVRYLVACQIKVASGEKTVQWFQSLLESKVAHHYCAASDGLYFIEAFYKNFHFQKEIHHPFIDLKSI